jgi:hypothetical protein
MKYYFIIYYIYKVIVAINNRLLLINKFIENHLLLINKLIMY